MKTASMPTPEHILKTATGYWATKVLNSAVHYQLFTILAQKGPQSARELKMEWGLACQDRHVYDFLDSLVSMGFLQRKGLLEEGVYSNTPDTDLFLDKSKPSYIGGIIEMMNHRLYGFWGDLEEGLATGCPQNEAKCGDNLFEAIYADPDRLREFVYGMRGVQLGNFMAFSKKFDFSGYQTLVDIGGSSGMLSLLVAKENPQLKCVTWDLPPVEPLSRETIAEFGMEDRVKPESGDFFKDDFPKADIVVMGNILHDWDEPTKRMLMKKAFEALPSGGCFVAIENVIDNERRENTFGLMMSLNMLIETGSGFDYTFADFEGWARDAGFTSTSILPLAGPTSAVIAHKG